MTDQAASGAERTGRIVVIAACAVAALALLLHVSPWLTAGLGDSHDGYNAATWGLGARGAVEDPIGNRLGGVHPDGQKYANHPPLLLWSLIPVTAIDDHSAFALRLVPLAASLAALALLALILLDSGVGSIAAAAGVLLAASSAMFLTFGAMVDTPVFGFPFALAAVWAAQRAWQGRPPPPWVCAVIGFLAALAGWQAFLTLAIAAAVAMLRRERSSRVAALQLAAGGFVGLLIVLGWVWWVLGSLSGLMDAGVYRMEFDTTMWLRQQRAYVAEMYGTMLMVVVLLGGIASIVAWRLHATPPEVADEPAQSAPQRDDDHDRDDQPADTTTGSAWDSPGPLFMFSVLALATVAYSFLFRFGSFAHIYWNYYGIALVGVAGAASFDTGDRLTRRFSPVARTMVVVLGVTTLFTVVGLGMARRSIADAGTQTGLDVVPLVERLPTATHPDQKVVTTVGGDPAKPWIVWATRGHSEPVDFDRVADLPQREPVLVTLPFVPDPSTWTETSAHANGPFALLPAGELARLLGGG